MMIPFKNLQVYQLEGVYFTMEAKGLMDPHESFSFIKVNSEIGVFVLMNLNPSVVEACTIDEVCEVFVKASSVYANMHGIKGAKAALVQYLLQVKPLMDLIANNHLEH